MDSNFWYIASYPKSGNTWCRVFISELLRLQKNSIEDDNFVLNNDINTGDSFSSRIWIDDQLCVDSSDLKRKELEEIRYLVGKSKRIYSEGLRFHKIHDAFYNKYNANNSTVCNTGCKGAIYIIRNPFDICISLSNFLNWDIKTCIKVITDSQFWLNSSNFSCSFHVSQFLGSWDYHIESWLNQNKIPILLIKYEDLISEPFKNFSKISSFIGFSGKESLISKAISNSSFTKLRAKEEKEGGFVESPYGCENFFRKGKVGEGKKLLTHSQIQSIEKVFYKSLNKFGYN